MKHNAQKFHQLGFVILPILFLITIFSVGNIWKDTTILAIAYFDLLLLVRPIKYKTLLIFILCLIPVLVAIFLSSFFYANISNISNLDIALLLTIRYFSLAIISFAFALHTQFPLVFNYLIEHKILSVKIGYAILAAFNSFYFLSDEFLRIQIAYKMRYGKHCYSPLVFIALLTAAARYAHNLSISMYSRGINEHKTFVITALKLRPKDYILWLVNLTAMVLLWIFG